ncbi:MAG TPA: hypothetical protein VFI37_08310 [Gaiellaceae bacterium]|nr:hypothetical protein [Gaiellaceae bacterium]
MDSAASLVDRATERLPLPHARNGGPPARGTDLTPLVVLAIAFAIGLVAARLLDWRTHAHPAD